MVIMNWLLIDMVDEVGESVALVAVAEGTSRNVNSVNAVLLKLTVRNPSSVYH